MRKRVECPQGCRVGSALGIHTVPGTTDLSPHTDGPWEFYNVQGQVWTKLPCVWQTWQRPKP